ncbi:MAG: methyltransferase domain-containing protein [Anaerolineae bacterium]|nr:methyltransferase domain-containing protein [Anaerolineae bacterium]
MKTVAEVQADFDRIAQVDADEDGGWNHNTHHHDYLLRHAPARCAEALEVGCGSGEFARLLARRSGHVLALDLSPGMLTLARQRSAAYPQIEYVQADVMNYPLPAARFDCIASIATLHHLALADVLPKLKAALKPGGVLLVLDLCRDEGLGDLLRSAAAVPLNMALKRLRGGNRAESPEARAAWHAHGHDEVFPAISEVRRACAGLLPGAEVKRHLLWRYSLVWTKP